MALYVMLIVSLIFYLNLGKDIEAIGFKVNPCEPCVVNNIIREKQMTITWHDDDLKVSHDDKDIVEAFIKLTKDTY